MDISNKKVAYFEGRPHGHPIHTKYAESVGSKIFHIDKYLRYQDIPTASHVRRLCSYLLTALCFPVWKYDVILSQEGYFALGLMKYFKRLHNKPLIGMMATHTPYYIVNKKYNKRTLQAFIKTYQNYDVFICIGDYEYELMQQIIGKTVKTKLLKSFNGVSTARINKLKDIKINFDQPLHLIFIGDCSSIERIKIKGLDLLIEVYLELKMMDSKVSLTILGDVDLKALKEVIPLKNIDVLLTEINFVGQVNNIEKYLNKANFYVHLARGESWGIAVNEAMLAGLPTLVSEETGAKMVVKEIYPNLVCSLDKEQIVTAISNYLKLSSAIKENDIKKGKNLILSQYTEERAIENFQKCFYEAIS